MKFYKIKKNKKFVGRTYWWKRLQEINKKKEATVIVIYGRRRVGKTELIEQFFLNQNVLKFEGLQPDRKTKINAKRERKRQITECLRRLGNYVEKEQEYRYIKLDRWSEFFEILTQYVEKNNVILYFEEIQWLSNYQDEFLAELKPFWDDVFRKNKKLRIIFSGSSPSFVVGQFMSNTAFYNRSENLIHLKPFNLIETKEYLAPKGTREVMLAALTTGGVCEYLKQIKDEPSVYTGLCKKAFEPTSFFSIECDKVFISSLSANRHYKKIVDYLAHIKFADRNEIYKAVVPGKKNLKEVSPGGSFTMLLDDLESLGFIDKYTPLISKNENSRLMRYSISDEYLHFYFKFIKSRIKEINNGKFIKDPLTALNSHNFAKAMGFSFERWCRKNEMIFARIMNFGNVAYRAGSFFNRNINSDIPGFQIDLMYIRKDSKIIICEIKYYDEEVNSSAEKEVARKIELFKKYNTEYRNYTFEKALITTEGAQEAIVKREFFDYIISFDDIFNPAHWD